MSASSHSHHVLPRGTMLKVYGALLVLTVLTYAVAQVSFGSAIDITIAIAIAAVKASLVAMFFMQLKWDNQVNTMVFVSGIVFLAVLLGLTLIDTTVRGPDLDTSAVTTEQPAGGASGGHTSGSGGSSSGSSSSGH